MYAGRVKGLMTFGMNGVQIGPNAKKNIDQAERLLKSLQQRQQPKKPTTP
jgi:hypothetical protein